jgi:hypothetical protein
MIGQCFILGQVVEPFVEWRVWRGEFIDDFVQVNARYGGSFFALHCSFEMQ